MVLGDSFVVWTICFSCLLAFAFGATGPNLVPDEVNALGQIARRLGKTNWDFSVDPCSGQSGWKTLHPLKGSENAVTCNCSSDNTVCHVTSILLKSQGLPGVLPPELVKLPYLREIDFTRNYLNGTIPPEWGSTKLEIISLQANRLSGSIPKELGNITTLEQLVLDHNYFSGVLPPELGNLVNLQRLLLSSNNLTGQLPDRLYNLVSLKDFRVSDNKFSGKIPSTIGNWTKLTKLEMQASGFEGPIPSEISILENLIDIRISDINGPDTSFPSLGKMNLTTLMLKSCNIIGELPPYLAKMRQLITLDLSFNKLSGQINSSFDSLSTVYYVILAANMLSGPVPLPMLETGRNIDLSYNNFTIGNSGVPDCQDQNVNLFRSSFRNSSVGAVPCLKSSQCPEKRLYKLHINCGGKEAEVNGSKYEADQAAGGPSKFFKVNYWAFSSTGSYVDNNNYIDIYIASNTSTLSMEDSVLYTNARASPNSLTYIAYCLLNGSYTVKLHFAEIIFTNEKNYTSLGRRVFDVYIQGNLVLKDFNIIDEAGGAGKAVIKKFPTVNVTTDTLEIRFYWAGKGTQRIPSAGNYGPLVSAISVEANFLPPPDGKRTMSAGVVAGVVISIVGFIFLVLGFLRWRGCLCNKSTMNKDLIGLDVQTGSFTLRQIKDATNNFDDGNKIGQGGFGSVYKGLLSDGTLVAVKKLSSKSKQGNREFLNEIGMISALKHPHLVKIYGCCTEGNQLLLVYEYMENNSLARALFGPEERHLKLDWPTRHKICIGIARGLAYLHEESTLKIVHRDIKATNILLDKDLNPKISDFGLAKLDEEENTHISTRVAGTFGYMAPEYAMRGHLTDKADIYSFGIVALEIVSGKSNSGFRPEEDVYLLDWVHILKEKGALIDIVDPMLGSEFNEEQVVGMINVALLCTNPSASLRPAMSSVVSMLEGQVSIQEFASDAGFCDENLSFKAAIRRYKQNQDQSISESQTQSMLIDGPWSGSTAAQDLYPTDLDSRYWDHRE